MPDEKDILTARNLHKYFGQGQARVHVLRGCDLAVRRGEFLAVMGPSGCGKSTLLHILGLMTEPSPAEPQQQSSLILDGQQVPPGDRRVQNELRRTKIGFIFQRFNLLSVLTAQDNVEVSLRVRGLRQGGRGGGRRARATRT